MEIYGSIEEIIFRNDENGYTVAVLSYENNKVEEYITITGKLADIKVGEMVKLEGKYVNTKYGSQFCAF